MYKICLNVISCSYLLNDLVPCFVEYEASWGCGDVGSRDWGMAQVGSWVPVTYGLLSGSCDLEGSLECEEFEG